MTSEDDKTIAVSLRTNGLNIAVENEQEISCETEMMNNVNDDPIEKALANVEEALHTVRSALGPSDSETNVEQESPIPKRNSAFMTEILDEEITPPTISQDNKESITIQLNATIVETEDIQDEAFRGVEISNEEEEDTRMNETFPKAEEINPDEGFAGDDVSISNSSYQMDEKTEAIDNNFGDPNRSNAMDQNQVMDEISETVKGSEEMKASENVNTNEADQLTECKANEESKTESKTENNQEPQVTKIEIHDQVNDIISKSEIPNDAESKVNEIVEEVPDNETLTQPKEYENQIEDEIKETIEDVHESNMKIMDVTNEEVQETENKNQDNETIDSFSEIKSEDDEGIHSQSQTKEENKNELEDELINIQNHKNESGGIIEINKDNKTEFLENVQIKKVTEIIEVDEEKKIEIQNLNNITNQSEIQSPVNESFGNVGESEPQIEKNTEIQSHTNESTEIIEDDKESKSDKSDKSDKSVNECENIQENELEMKKSHETESQINEPTEIIQEVQKSKAEIKDLVNESVEEVMENKVGNEKDNETSCHINGPTEIIEEVHEIKSEITDQVDESIEEVQENSPEMKKDTETQYQINDSTELIEEVQETKTEIDEQENKVLEHVQENEPEMDKDTETQSQINDATEIIEVIQESKTEINELENKVLEHVQENERELKKDTENQSQNNEPRERIEEELAKTTENEIDLSYENSNNESSKESPKICSENSNQNNDQSEATGELKYECSNESRILTLTKQDTKFEESIIDPVVEDSKMLNNDNEIFQNSVEPISNELLYVEKPSEIINNVVDERVLIEQTEKNLSTDITANNFEIVKDVVPTVITEKENLSFNDNKVMNNVKNNNDNLAMEEEKDGKRIGEPSKSWNSSVEKEIESNFKIEQNNNESFSNRICKSKSMAKIAALLNKTEMENVPFIHIAGSALVVFIALIIYFNR